jgi:DNA-binding NarL/FixJ family response regulator
MDQNKYGIHMGPREEQIVDYLLEGMDNEEMAKHLGIARRTVKAHFNRLYLRFGITCGIKRVKLAVMCYRRLNCSTQQTNSPKQSIP